MKTFGWMAIGVVALVAFLAVACGDGDDDSPASGDTGTGVSLGGGMIAPDQFLTYEGKRYELVNMLFENMVPADQFEAVGEATESDVDLKGDMRVFTREGDSTAVYTYSAPTADDQGLWLAWRLVG